MKPQSPVSSVGLTNTFTELINILEIILQQIPTKMLVFTELFNSETLTGFPYIPNATESELNLSLLCH